MAPGLKGILSGGMIKKLLLRKLAYIGGKGRGYVAHLDAFLRFQFRSIRSFTSPLLTGIK